ncbi:putative Inosine-5'-monophosphate dehydrogenase 1b-like 2, partial [Homarus americanus]
APRLFQQLYVIRAPLGPSAVTCVYAFLSAKSQTIYEEFLQAICDKALDKDSRGEPPRKRVKRASKEHQQRLKSLCVDYVNEKKTLEEFLNGIGHNIRWK